MAVGGRVIRYVRVSSTQDVARGLAAAGAPEGTVVVAEAQTAGRGRFGRRWHSPPGGGLWMSVILYPERRRGCAPVDLPSLSLSCSVAAARALETVAEGFLRVGLKWPNDLVVGSRKLGGILLEGDTGSAAVIAGIGVNLALPAPLPPEAAGAVDLATAAGRPFAADDVLQALLAELDTCYETWLARGFGPFREEWLARCEGMGGSVTVVSGSEEVRGLLEGIDEAGCLVVALADGTRRAFQAGEVTWRCPSPAPILFLSSSLPAGANVSASPGQ